MKCQGFYKFEVRNKDGETTYNSEWQKNLIVDYGMNQLFPFSLFFTNVCVGSGATPPTVNDYDLVEILQYSDNLVDGTLGSEPGYSFGRLSYMFPEFSGVVREAGVFQYDNMFSRILLDTPLGITTSDTLLLSYELRLYTPTVSETNVTIEGYPYTMTQSFSESHFASIFEQEGYVEAVLNTCTANNYTILAEDGITATFINYDDINFTADVIIVLGINIVDDISSIEFGPHVVSFDPPIPKVANTNLALSFTLSWARPL